MRAAEIFKKDDSCIVEGIIVLDSLASIPAIKEAFNIDYLIPIDESVNIGAYYNPDKDIFTNESGDRLYPPKTAAERLDEMEAQITDTQAALIELAGIVGGSDNG